ncbi:hypothetical protein BDZ91DRAFT_345504 [Kalaharituber pfeilii]|nr:hypothetical protein BDZ91DRAFT_345504 [Kalaharituber pfeilii]
MLLLHLKTASQHFFDILLGKQNGEMQDPLCHRTNWWPFLRISMFMLIPGSCLFFAGVLAWCSIYLNSQCSSFVLRFSFAFSFYGNIFSFSDWSHLSSLSSRLLSLTSSTHFDGNVLVSFILFLAS